MKHPTRSIAIAVGLAAGSLFALVQPAAADPLPDQVCAPSFEVSPLRRLRQTSLDLLGRPPTFDEIETVTLADDPAAAVDDLVAGMFDLEEYRERLVEHHRSLLWGGIDQGALNNQYRIAQIPNTDVWYRNSQSVRLNARGGRQVTCVDQAQVGYTAGRPNVMNTYNDPDCDGGVCRQEGWVMVTPYWKDTPIKVCAYDAQDFEFGLDGETSCDVRPGNEEGCGCGENLNRCWSSENEQHIRNALMDEGSHTFGYFAVNGRNYLDAFTTNKTLMNGPITHYYREMVHDDPAVNGTSAEGVAFNADIGELPGVIYSEDDSWHVVERGDAHAGAFTSAGFLMRFASNRARANRFYTAFYCDPFVPSADGLPPEEANPSPNLRERAGCKDCHETLEVAAAHFTRWRTTGDYGLLAEGEMSLDTLRDDCMCGPGTNRPNCSAFCGQYYVTAENSDPDTYELYGGLPMALVYGGEPDHAAADSGPAALVEQPGEQRAITECAVRNMAEALLHRPIEFDEIAWVEDLADEFEAGGYDFTAMVETIVNDERYLQTR